MITHLETIDVPLDKLVLGFSETNPQLTWNIYLDTWRMVDKGETDVKKLPLYGLMKNHYCSKNVKRLTYEKTLLSLNTVDCEKIAEEWVKKHIELYYSIKTKGYKPELRTKPVAVRIRGDGSFLLLDGTHTVSILRYLKLQEKIFAKVEMRERGWETLKKNLYDIYGKKLLYQPINHPDFTDWDVDRASPHRWNTIKRVLGDVKDVTILDVGCMTGWFSHNLALMGARVTGLEPHEKRYMACKTLSKYHGLTEDNPRFLQECFEEHLKHNHYDVVLVLSVLHHYLRRSPAECYDAFKLLGETCDCMILEMGLNRLPVPWRPELVLENSRYTKYTTLYIGERPIYLFTW